MGFFHNIILTKKGNLPIRSLFLMNHLYMRLCLHGMSCILLNANAFANGAVCTDLKRVSSCFTSFLLRPFYQKVYQHPKIERFSLICLKVYTKQLLSRTYSVFTSLPCPVLWTLHSRIPFGFCDSTPFTPLKNTHTITTGVVY